MDNNYQNHSIKELADRIRAEIYGGSIFGIKVDINNIDHVMVAAYAYAYYKKPEREETETYIVNVNDKTTFIQTQHLSVCTWSDGVDYDLSIWETTCGNCFVFNEDGPIENGFKFCPYCGCSLSALTRS